jgi:hypothetical protein
VDFIFVKSWVRTSALSPTVLTGGSRSGKCWNSGSLPFPSHRAQSHHSYQFALHTHPVDIVSLSKSKAVPLHAMKAPGVEEV